MDDLKYAWHVRWPGDDALYDKACDAAAMVYRKNHGLQDPSPDELEDLTNRLTRDDKLEIGNVTARIRRIW